MTPILVSPILMTPWTEASCATLTHLKRPGSKFAIECLDAAGGLVCLELRKELGQVQLRGHVDANDGVVRRFALNPDTGPSCGTGKCLRPLEATWHQALRTGARSSAGISVSTTGRD